MPATTAALHVADSPAQHLWTPTYDLACADPEHRDYFVRGMIHEGASSIARFMALTYLSQFEHLDEPSAHSPIFRPDALILGIPHSSDLIALVNDVYGRGFIYGPWSGDKEMHVRFSTSENTGVRIAELLREGGNLGLLYERNLANIARFKEAPHRLYKTVRDCVERDKHVSEAFLYLGKK